MSARSIAPLLAAATLAGACSHHSSGHAHYDPYTYEVEPNDVYWNAQHLGSIAVGEEILLRGHVSDNGYDLYDGFAFHTAQPMEIEFALFADDPHADFDVELFDPYEGQTVAVWETGANPESGSFSIWSGGFEFHLVVSSFVGTGDYVLEVRGRPLGWLGAQAAGIAATGLSTRAERSVDWTGYSRPQAPAPLPRDLPVLKITTLELDPLSGELRGVRTREVYAGELEEDGS